jgi:hypothetical protein
MKYLKLALLFVLFPSIALAAKQTVNNGETMNQARTKINSNFTELYTGVLAGDCTVMPCFDGTTGSGTYFKLLGTDGTHWSAIQAGNVLANITHRLPLTLPAAGTTRLINTDEYGNWGLVDASTIGGYSNLTSFVDQTAWRVFYSDGSGDVKELALGADGTYLKSNGASSVPTWATPTGSGASVSDVAYDATSWNAITDAAPSKNAVRDWIESLPSLVISTGLTDNSGTVSVTNPVTAEAFSGSGWNADTEGLTRNDAYDYTHIADTDDDGLINKVDLSSAGMVKVDSSGVLSVGTVGVDYEASTPATKIVATTGAVSASDFLAAKYISNYGASGTVAITLPAVSYNVSRAIIAEAGQIIQVTPPSGEAFSTPIGTQTADEVISSTNAVGSTIIATRYKTGASTWAFRLDPVNGTWTESGGASLDPSQTKEIGWTIKDSDVVTAVADGKQAAVIPASLNGMNLVDLTCSVSDLNSAASGTTTVVLRRVRGATAVDMTSTGVTIAYNEHTASDETVDTDNDDVATGDKIFVDVNAVTSAAQKGLYCTASFRLP